MTIGSAMRGWPLYLRILVPLVLVLSFGGAAYASVSYTEQPGFCPTCHEMSPYAKAWAEGPHKDVSCLECHVDRGLVAHMSHKVVALKEVWSHFTEEQRFPQSERAEVPDERCRNCHERIDVARTGFSHTAHAAEGPCQDCHSASGHTVTTQALADAGILNVKAASAVGTEVAEVGGGAANIEGHIAVSCSSCHDMAKTGCESCHEPKHTGTAKKTAACTTCHSAGEKFVFTHPAGGADCASCHEPKHTGSAKKTEACVTCHTSTSEWAFTHPASPGSCSGCHERPKNHRSGECDTCHRNTKKWTFSHPSAKSACTSCHTRPAGHRTGTCGRCHRSTSSWAFSHPSGRSGCTSCHKKPSGHKSGTCTRCHSVGRSWAFSHPGSGATCTGCHKRPGGHRSGGCTSCHRTSSWKFRHPGSSACKSCHNAPSNHYGSSCSSCHSASRSWSSASFSHPSIRGGKHTYKSFACSKCHPSGYDSATCRSCHDSNSGPSDDDDD